MKKITFIVLHLGFGGVEKAIANQANILCQDFDVQIISAYKLYEQPPFFIDPRVKITYLMTDIKPNPQEFKAAIRSLNPIRIIKEGIISIRVLHNRTSLMRKAITKCDTDVLVSSRILYNPLLRYKKNPNTVTISQEHRHHDGDLKYISKLCKSVASLDYFMPVSQELTDFYQERLNGQKVKCLYIPHNIDSWPEKPSDLTNKQVVGVGRLSPEKGFPDLVKAFAEFHKSHPDWTLHIVGDGNEKETIQNLISNFNLDSHVILHGYLEKDDVNKILSQSSIYAMASHSESFGIVLIEAQSHGLPCIAYDTARGALEIISHGKDGYLIPNRNQESYVAHLEMLSDDFALRQSLGSTGRTKSWEYSEEVISQKLVAFYNNILKEVKNEQN